MQDIVDATLKLEKSKIDVQLKLFSEQMEYQREKDCHIYKSNMLVNENVRLAILKQGKMVSCLLQHSSVLSKGLLSIENKEIQGLSEDTPNIFTSTNKDFNRGFTAHVTTSIATSTISTKVLG